MGSTLTPIPWWEAEPETLVREIEAMSVVAPSMRWADELPEKGWEGEVPLWPFQRPAPADLEELVGGQRLNLLIAYTPAHPIVAPCFYPLSPETDPNMWTLHTWHLNGDGSLCLFQDATTWTPEATAADLISKAASWFLQFVLVSRGFLNTMTECGIVNDDALDHLFAIDRAPA